MQPLRLNGFAATGVLICTALMGLTGCNDDPSPVGSEYLPETVRFASYVVGASEMEITSGHAMLANSTSRGAATMLVGQAPDGTTAHALLAITDPIKVLEGSAPREVTAVSLRFRTLTYRYGDLADRQSVFDVVVLDETALDTIRWGAGIVSKIEAAPVLGTYTGVIPDSANITVPLDVTAARQFLREYYVYDSTQSFVSRKTLALRARSGSRVIAALLGATFIDVADSLRPSMIVTMGDSTATLKIGVSSWIGDVPVQTGPNRIVVAGGEPVRTFIQVKPEALPLGATIHQARLTLRVDTAQTKYGSGGATTYVVLYDADGTSTTTFLGRALGRLMGGFRTKTETSFTDLFDFNTVGPSITAAVRSRRAGGAAVAPFVLALGRGSGSRPDQESATVDRVVFHGMDAADASLRPNLTIIYSTQTDAP